MLVNQMHVATNIPFFWILNMCTMNNEHGNILSTVHQWTSDVCRMLQPPPCWCQIKGWDSNLPELSLRNQQEPMYTELSSGEGGVRAPEPVPVLQLPATAQPSGSPPEGALFRAVSLRCMPNIAAAAGCVQHTYPLVKVWLGPLREITRAGLV